MSDVTRILYETAGNSETERQAARRAVTSWCARHNLGPEAAIEIFDELGLR